MITGLIAACVQRGIGLRALAAEVGLDPLLLQGWCAEPEWFPEVWRREVDAVLTRWRIPLTGIWTTNEAAVPEADTPPRLRLVTREAAQAKAGAEVEAETPMEPDAPEATASRQDAEEEQPMQILQTLTKTTLTGEELEAFGLKMDPFDLDPDPESIWQGRHQREAERRVYNAAIYYKVVALVGDVGSGKSTILRRVVSRWQRDRKVIVATPATIDRRALDEFAITSSILRALAPGQTIPGSREARAERLAILLEEAHSKGARTCLLIEEAHDLGVEAFVALKRVWDSGSLLKRLGIVLVGIGSDRDGDGVRAGRREGGIRPLLQGDLASRLTDDPRVTELGQRADVVRLKPLTADEVGEYLSYRFGMVGAHVGVVFEPGAFKALAEPRGYAHPLAVGNRAALSMRRAFEMGDTTVTADHVVRAIQ